MPRAAPRASTAGPRESSPSASTLAGTFSRTWDDVHSNTFGLDGLRHVVQPYINYSYLNADPIEGLPTIDRLSPSTRPRPLDVPLFTAVDSLNSWNIARVGVRNSLQTKRDGVAYNWMGLNTYADIFFEDPEFDRDVSNLYNDFFWRPVPWLQFITDSPASPRRQRLQLHRSQHRPHLDARQELLLERGPTPTSMATPSSWTATSSTPASTPG